MRKMPDHMRGARMCALAGLLLCALAQLLTAQAVRADISALEISERVSFDGAPGALTLDGFSGEIEITRTWKSEAAVRTIIRPGRESAGSALLYATARLKKKVSGNECAIALETGMINEKGYNARTTVAIPNGWRLKIRCGEADISATELSLALLDVDSEGAGSIRISGGSPAKIEIKGGAASVFLSGTTGDASVSTGGGSITATAHTGSLAAAAGAGAISVSGGTGPRSLTTLSGAINIEIPAPETAMGNYQLSLYEIIANSIDGDLTLSAPGALFTIAARTAHGRLRVRGEGYSPARREIPGGVELDSGPGRFTLSSDEGNITVAFI